MKSTCENCCLTTALLSLCLALAANCRAGEPAAEGAADALPESGANASVDLLAEGSLRAWRGYKKDHVPEQWALTNGVLSFSGAGGGDLITREQYGDFDFRFEWKVSEGGNSGVIYRLTETDGPAYMTGPEYQVLDDSKHKDGGNVLTSSASLYGLYARSEDVVKPVGEWNKGRIVLRDGRVEHWLNGRKVVDAHWGDKDWNTRLAKSKFADWKGFAKNDRGHIALQDHGDRVSYRNLNITSLDRPAGQAAGRAARVLFVTQSGGFRHSSVTRKAHELSHAERVMQRLGIQSGDFRVDCTQDVGNDFKPELIENYDLVVFFTTGTMFNEENRLPIDKTTLDWFLQEWLTQPGHGFLGVHAAADTFEDYEPYWDMIGGSFNGHPWGAGSTVTITVHDQEHPAMKPWGEGFEITDEIYQFKHWQPEKVRVLMSLNMEKTELKKPYHVPVCWVKQYGEGRVMHMSLGHREDVWTNEKYQQSLLGGIRWLLGKAPGGAIPNPELSAEEEEKARAAAG